MDFCSAIRMQSNIELHPKCIGCIKITESGLCSMYHEPMRQWSKWPMSGCAGKPKEQIEEKGTKSAWLDPIKASKRGVKQ